MLIRPLNKQTEDSIKRVVVSPCHAQLSSAHLLTYSVSTSISEYGHSKSSSERLLKHRLESWQTAPNFQTIPTLEKSRSQIRKPHSTLHPPGEYQLQN